MRHPKRRSESCCLGGGAAVSAPPCQTLPAFLPLLLLFALLFGDRLSEVWASFGGLGKRFQTDPKREQSRPTAAWMSALRFA